LFFAFAREAMAPSARVTGERRPEVPAAGQRPAAASCLGPAPHCPSVPACPCRAAWLRRVPGAGARGDVPHRRAGQGEPSL